MLFKKKLKQKKKLGKFILNLKLIFSWRNSKKWIGNQKQKRNLGVGDKCIFFVVFSSLITIKKKNIFFSLIKPKKKGCFFFLFVLHFFSFFLKFLVSSRAVCYIIRPNRSAQFTGLTFLSLKIKEKKLLFLGYTWRNKWKTV